MICTDVKPYLPSCSDEKWRVVSLERTFRDMFDPNKTVKKVDDYLLNTETGRFWHYDTPCHFRHIGFNVILGYPICGICSVAFHILRMPYDVIKGIVIAFSKICDDYQEYSKSGSVPLSVILTFASFVKRLTSEIVIAICQDILSIIKDPFYTVALTLIGVYMLFCPYEGRSLLDIVEKHWRGGVPVQQDIREVPCDCNSIHDLIVYFQSVNVCYLAWCCQSRGSILDTEIVKLVIPKKLEPMKGINATEEQFARQQEKCANVYKKHVANYCAVAAILAKNFPHLRAQLYPQVS